MYRGARYIPGKVLEKRVAKARSLSNPFSFSPLKHGKRDIENITCSVFRVFNAWKPIGLDSDLANVIRRSKTYLGIYRSSPCLKAVTSYKVTTKQRKVHAKIEILECLARSRTLYRNVREKLGRHFGSPNDYPKLYHTRFIQKWRF